MNIAIKHAMKPAITAVHTKTLSFPGKRLMKSISQNAQKEIRPVTMKTAITAAIKNHAYIYLVTILAT